MYHYIGYAPDPEDDLRQRLTVSPENFRAQIAYLATNGYTPIDLYTLSRAITGQELLPEKPVLITVDDGYVDAYQYAFPVLQEFGFTATFFIVTEFVDFNYPAYMNWDMIEEMASAGMRMEPHTKTHPDLRNHDRAFLIYEILGSLQTLEAHIGYRPRYFAYPGGAYDEFSIEILQELDFWGAVITLGGKWHNYDDRYEWRRLRVRHDMPLAEFIDLVDPGPVQHGVSEGLLDNFVARLP
jgi:peptidoglycan/xylan/chitin deacetylase (PgdA/CDA1 family)